MNMELPESSVYAGTLELTVITLLADTTPPFSRSRLILADVLALLWRIGVKIEVQPYDVDGLRAVSAWIQSGEGEETAIATEDTTTGSQAAALICQLAWKIRRGETTAPQDLALKFTNLLKHLEGKLK